MTAFLGLLLAASTVGGDRPTLLACGGDLNRGVLLNRTPGTRPDSPIDPTLPTVVFIHGYNPLPRTVHFEMARRLGESLGRRPGGCGFNVLDWDWNAATSSGFASARTRKPRSTRAPAGVVLAPGRSRPVSTPPDRPRRGEPRGGRRPLGQSSIPRGVLVAQLTFLEPAAFYHEFIFEHLAAGTAASRVENYWAAGPERLRAGRPLCGRQQCPGLRRDALAGRGDADAVGAPGHRPVVRRDGRENPGCPRGFNASVLLGR